MIGDIPMRRFENQIHDRDMIRAILDNTLVVHVGIDDGDYPYVVPLSYGYEMTEEKLLIYLHSTKEGHKVDLWKKDPKVSLTISMFTNHPNDLYRGAMHDFRCIMANGVIRKIGLHDKGHGTAVQAILRHNGRRPNQFSVPHYMFMDVYVVECDWKHVSAKSEEPMKHPKEVPFPTMEEIRASTEAPYDYSYFFSRKTYGRKGDGKEPVLCSPDLKGLSESEKILLGGHDGEVTLRFRWDFGKAAPDRDVDVLAVVLDENGKIPRRYDIAFYNQKADRSGAIRHLGDDILAEQGQERVAVNLRSVPDYCRQIVFWLAVYEADARDQSLDMVKHVQLDVESGDGKKYAAGISIPEGWHGKEAAAAVKMVRQTDGSWIIEGPDQTALDDWHATAIFANYGLKRWKE